MTYPDTLTLAVTVGGTTFTTKIIPGSLNITNVLTRQIDTCTFTIEGASATPPSDWDEIIITDAGTRIFAGYVVNVEEVLGADLDIDYRISGSDYAILLEKAFVREEFTNQTDAQILNSLFTDYLSEINATTYVSTTNTIPKIRFNRVSLRQALDLLADLGNADWYIDYNKNLHFFVNEENFASFSLSDAPDLSASFPYDGLMITRDGSGVINRIEIVGGDYLSEDQTFYLEGTGQDNRIIMPFNMYEPEAGGGLKVYRNDNTEASPTWTQLTVKVGYIDTISLTTEVLHYFQERVIEQVNNWPNLPNAVKVVGRYDVPLRSRVRDEASYTHYGRWMDGVIVDAEIVDKSVAKMRGRVQLAQSAMAKTAIELICQQPGLRSGEKIRLVNSLHGIDEDYLIQKVTTTVSAGGLTVNNVSLGVYSGDLVDLIVSLARNARPKSIWRDDEVLDEIFNQAETMALTEGTPTVANTAAPYTWGVGGSNDFNWGFGKWS